MFTDGLLKKNEMASVVLERSCVARRKIIDQGIYIILGSTIMIESRLRLTIADQNKHDELGTGVLSKVGHRQGRSEKR